MADGGRHAQVELTESVLRETRAVEETFVEVGDGAVTSGSVAGNLYVANRLEGSVEVFNGDHGPFVEICVVTITLIAIPQTKSSEETTLDQLATTLSK